VAQDIVLDESDSSEAELPLNPFTIVGRDYFALSSSVGTPAQTHGKFMFSTSVMSTIMTGEGCASTQCAEIAYMKSASTSMQSEGDCPGGRRAEYEVDGDLVIDKVCLGTNQDEPNLCADELEFCSVTGGETGEFFNYINGIIGFAPISERDSDTMRKRSFIYETDVDNKVSWNFNFEPNNSTVRLGGKNDDDYLGG